MTRRLINVVGTLVVIVALIAGTLLMALPVYLESVDIRNEKAQVAAANQILVVQIDALRAKQAELPQLEEELGDLRSELPHIPQLDDVAKLALRAADKSDGTIQDITFGDPTGFIPRVAEDVVPNLPSTATDLPGDEPGQDGTQEPAPGDTAADAGSDSGSGTSEPAGPAPTGADQLQVPVTVIVAVPDSAAAARFLDELRAGPRLFQIDNAAGSRNASPDRASVTLTVNGLVFVQSK